MKITLFFLIFLLPASLIWGGESGNGENDFEFPPLTVPVMDEDIIGDYSIELIAMSGTGTACGIGMVVYGVLDIIAETTESGYFSCEVNRGILFTSLGFILGGISVTILKTAIESSRRKPITP
jgi:hypothetical protein